MSQHSMSKRLSILGALAAASFVIAGTAQAGAHSGQGVSKVEELPVRSGDWSEAEIVKGRKQLVAAIDAAWIRIINSGRDQEVLKKYPRNMPGASQSYMVRLAGNIGKPLLECDDRGVDWWVIELSSYQLADLEAAPTLAVLLNLSPEHLDWHGDAETYCRDKLR